ncbi:MAG: hypothetical protein M1833_003996 [Piccolia ochrophora]|nr:MAG: hypothetical protein M1833_003996 [Piccolia ochrophora]
MSVSTSTILSSYPVTTTFTLSGKSHCKNNVIYYWKRLLTVVPDFETDTETVTTTQLYFASIDSHASRNNDCAASGHHDFGRHRYYHDYYYKRDTALDCDVVRFDGDPSCKHHDSHRHCNNDFNKYERTPCIYGDLTWHYNNTPRKYDTYYRNCYNHCPREYIRLLTHRYCYLDNFCACANYGYIAGIHDYVIFNFNVPASIVTIDTPPFTSTIVGPAPGQETLPPATVLPPVAAVPNAPAAPPQGTTYTTTQAVSTRICPRRVTNPTYTAPGPLPTDYTWGCPPGYICKPPKINCDIEEGFPDRGYYCSPDECEPVAPLESPQYWGEPIESNDTDKYVLQDDYFNLNPLHFSLGYDNFVEELVIVVDPDGTARTYEAATYQGAVETAAPAAHPAKHPAKRATDNGVQRWAKIDRRQQGETAPPSCYDDCNACGLEAQSTGKTPDLCEPESAFNSALGGCEACIERHEARRPPTSFNNVVKPDFQQFIDFCSGSSASDEVDDSGPLAQSEVSGPISGAGSAVAAEPALTESPAESSVPSSPEEASASDSAAEESTVTSTAAEESAAATAAPGSASAGLSGSFPTAAPSSAPSTTPTDASAAPSSSGPAIQTTNGASSLSSPKWLSLLVTLLLSTWVISPVQLI